uniref:Uncharacterized protein n=2 Tax=Physcomitrium patens TaxID=3218 RepID=A0A2K1KKN6_PHYPA|nr:hypothetical protein PHYPA_008017 [Physcomitrium patens]
MMRYSKLLGGRKSNVVSKPCLQNLWWAFLLLSIFLFEYWRRGKRKVKEPKQLH